MVRKCNRVHLRKAYGRGLCKKSWRNMSKLVNYSNCHTKGMKVENYGKMLGVTATDGNGLRSTVGNAYVCV